MEMISKGIRFTRKVPSAVEEDEPEPHPEPITEPTSKIHDVYVHCFENPLYLTKTRLELIYQAVIQILHSMDTSISIVCMIQSQITSMPRDSRRDKHLNQYVDLNSVIMI